MDTQPVAVTLRPGTVIALREQVAIAELPAFFGRAFSQLAACAGDRIAGPPFARYHAVGTGVADVEAAVPVRDPVPVRPPMTVVELAGGPAVQIEHFGPYEELHATYAALERWLDAQGQQRGDAVREIYLNAPNEVDDPADLATLVIQPLRA